MENMKASMVKIVLHETDIDYDHYGYICSLINEIVKNSNSYNDTEQLLVQE